MKHLCESGDLCSANMVRSILLRPWDLLCVLWFLAHIPMTVLLDAQSGVRLLCSFHMRAASDIAPCTTPWLCPTATAALTHRPPPLHNTVLPPHLLALMPAQLRQLLAWHIQTHHDHLVSVCVGAVGARAVWAVW